MQLPDSIPVDVAAAAVAASGWAGWLIGRRWPDIRRRLHAWGMVGPARQGRLVPRAVIAPILAPEPDLRPAWNAATLAFARRCARQYRISETATVDARIVATRRDYRVMAAVMERAGVWVSRGAGVPRQWADPLPGRAVARLRVDLARGRRLPYPARRPPPIGAVQ